MSENIALGPAGEVKLRAGRKEAETGLGQLHAPLALQHGIERILQAVQERNVVGGVPRQEYFTGVSILRATVDTTHPVMAGMPAEADVVVSGSPVFTTIDGFEGAVLAKYPALGSPLRSGFLHGEERMRGHAAAVDVKRGNGHIILIAFQPDEKPTIGADDHTEIPLHVEALVAVLAFGGKEIVAYELL